MLPMQPGVVLVLGATPWQRELLCAELARHDASVPPPADVNNEVPAVERIELYKSRAACFVTARIAVVDLLTSRLAPAKIAGAYC